MGVIVITKVEHHPTDENKIRVTFSEAANNTALTPANYAVTGLPTPNYVAFVSGSGNTQVDLQYGTDLPVDGNTVALWRFNETVLVASSPVLTMTVTRLVDGLTVSGTTSAAHKYVAGQWVYITGVVGPPAFGTGWFQLISAGGTTLQYTDPGTPGAGAGLSIRPSSLVDSSGNGYDLQDGAAVDLNGIMLAARTFDGVASWAPGQPTLTPRPSLLGDITIDALVRWDSTQNGSPNNTGDIIIYGGLANDTQAENMLLDLTVQDGTGLVTLIWEQGLGVDVSISTATGLPPGIATLITARRRLVGSTYTAEIFFNGRRVKIGSGLTGPDGGTSANMRIAVGANPANADNRFKGTMDTLRVSNIARTDAAIEAYALALLGSFRGLGAVTMVASNVQDSATSTPITVNNGTVEFNLYGNGVAPAFTDADAPMVLLENSAQYSAAVQRGGEGVVLPTPVTFTAALVGGKLHIVFDRPVFDAIELRLPSSWTLGLPSGAGPLTITHVETVPNMGSCNEAYITFTGELVNGGAYTVALDDGDARAYDPLDGGQNTNTPVNWTGVGAAPTVTAFYAVSADKVRVQFSESVRQVSPSNTDDALRPANYAILDPSLTPLTVLAVASLAPNLVELTTAPQVPNITYSFTVSNIKDLAGNVVT